MKLGNKIRKAIAATALGGAMAIASVPANAHTILIGTTNAGAPGSVNVFMGSYHGGTYTEGSITIGGVTMAFASAGLGDLSYGTGTLGMTLGLDAFYADNTVAGSYTALVNNTCCTLASWQSATFTGLSAGWHTYSITGMSSAHWADWNSSSPNWTGRLFIPGSSTGGQVPAPAALGFLGLGLAGLGIARRRRSS